jgi:CPA2 family monovalent cation:H+ antiporter-2
MSTVATVAEASQHLKPLISDLGLIMTAGIAVLIFKN